MNENSTSRCTKQSIRVLLGCAGLMTLASCGASPDRAGMDEQVDEHLGTTAQGLYLYSGIRYWTENNYVVPVCWYQSAGMTDIKARVRAAIEQQWQAHSRLKFTWAETCPIPDDGKSVQFQLLATDQIRRKHGAGNRWPPPRRQSNLHQCSRCARQWQQRRQVVRVQCRARNGTRARLHARAPAAQSTQSSARCMHLGDQRPQWRGQQDPRRRHLSHCALRPELHHELLP